MGYGALLPLKYEDKTIIPLLIFDDVLFATKTQFTSNYVDYLEDAAKYIDSVIPYLWSATAYPYNTISQDYHVLFPNWFKWILPQPGVSGKSTITFALSLNGGEISSNSHYDRYGISSSGKYTDTNTIFGFSGAGSIDQAAYADYNPMYFDVLILPEKCLINGNIKIDAGNQQIKSVLIEITRRNNKYRATINFPSSTANIEDVFDGWENLNGYSPIFLTTDPFSPGGSTNTGGGEGDFDGTSDAVDIPALPSASATDTGFITLFNPTLSQLKDLAGYMWSGAFDVATFRKLFADPMDCILGLSIVPVAVPNAGLTPVKVGNISTGIEMNIATSQYVTVDCGTINVNEYWGAYLDYDPYTKAEIYLPYIGTHPIATDDIMGKAVHVVYHVDILSGACTAYVKCGDSVLYSYIGQVSSSIPVTGNDWTNVINGVLSIAGSVGSMIATAGATTPLAVSSIASTAINSNKPSIARSGSMSGTGGMLALQTPYLILTRPRQAVPSNQNKYTGYPAFITSNLGSLEGYTEIESIHLEGVPATESELNEIESILKAGVIF